MTRTIQTSAFWFSVPLLILFFLIWLTQSSLYLSNPNPLTIGITLDFLITIPFIYALIVWKREVPKFTILSVLIVCTIVASYIIPSEQADLLNSIKMLLVPAIEIGILGFVIWQAWSIRKEYKENKHQKLDFFELMTKACSRSLPGRVGVLFATEIAVIYYAFFAPSKRELEVSEYTYFKKSGIKTVVVVILCMALVELFVVHLLVHSYYPTVAWVLTFFSAYACLQIIALLRSMNSRLFIIDEANNQLKLKYGFLNHTNIPLDKIKEIRLHRRTLPDDNTIIPLSPLDVLDSHNIIIDLKEEHTLNRMYGLTRKFMSIAIYVDEKDRFVEHLTRLIHCE